MDEKIIERFTEIGEEFTELTPNSKELALKINDFFIMKQAEQNHAIDILQKPSVSLLHLTEALGCSRTTIYTNTALKKLYKHLTTELDKDNPYVYIRKQKDNINEIQTQLNDCYDRDIATEKQRIEINNLNRLLLAKYKEIETFRLRIAKLTNNK